MNLKILDSWLRESLETSAKPKEIAEALSLAGPSVEHLNRRGLDFGYDLEITTNRVDTASVLGIAREAYAALRQHGFDAKLRPLKFVLPGALEQKALPLVVKDPQRLTRKVMALVLDNIEIKASAAQVQARLREAGIKRINNVVDITNYIMLEVGHPTHVFDYDRLKTHTLIFRFAKNGETIVTLDRKRHILTDRDLVIDDGTGRIIDLPGIMGAENSMVTAKTKRIVLFLEMTSPAQIRHTSMRLGIYSQAAALNQNSPDKQTAQNCFYRGVTLLRQWVNAKPAGVLIDLDRIHSRPKQILFSTHSLQNYLGEAVPLAQVRKILTDLGFKVKSAGIKQLLVTVPSYREKDINLTEDLIEEVSRLYGYQNLKSNLPPFYLTQDSALSGLDLRFEKEKLIRRFLSSRGLLELCNYSMLSQQYHDLFPYDNAKPLKMINPLSDELVYFRKTLVPSLVRAVNLNKNHSQLRVFEIGPVYHTVANNLPDETVKLAVLSTDSYSKLKGELEALLNYGHCLALLTEKPGSGRVYFDNALSSRLYLDNLYLGEIGRLRLQIQQELKIKAPIFIAELDLKILSQHLQFLGQIKTATVQNLLIEDLTYRFDGKHFYSQIKQTLLKRFQSIRQIEYVTAFEDFYTIRLFSRLGRQGSYLSRVIRFLEDNFNLQVKHLKVDSSK